MSSRLGCGSEPLRRRSPIEPDAILISLGGIVWRGDVVQPFLLRIRTEEIDHIKGPGRRRFYRLLLVETI